MTYMIPGYTEYYEEDGALYISSKLLQNKVKITEPKLQEEFSRNFPVFYREELTRDVLAARLWQGDFAGCSGASFGVLEPDGTLLEISVYAQDPLALLEFLLDG